MIVMYIHVLSVPWLTPRLKVNPNPNPNRVGTSDDSYQRYFIVRIKTFFLCNKIYISMTRPSCSIFSHRHAVSVHHGVVRVTVRLQSELSHLTNQAFRLVPRSGLPQGQRFQAAVRCRVHTVLTKFPLCPLTGVDAQRRYRCVRSFPLNVRRVQHC